MRSGTKKEPAVRTLRIILLSILLIPINNYFLIEMDIVRWSFPTYVVPFYNAIFILTVIVVLNFIIKRFFTSIALTQSELLTIISLSSCLCSHNMMEILVTTLGHPFWYATPENEWSELFGSYLPRWLTVSDKDVLRGYYEGNSSLHQVSQ